jgi:hypothetical protein
MPIKRKKGSIQKLPVPLMALAFFLAVAAKLAAPASSDVGLVTKLSGEATYWNKDEQTPPTQVQSFMKLRLGDHLKLTGSASLQLIYFANGRQEIWKGPVTLIVGDLESAAAGGKKPCQPEVAILPTKVAKNLGMAPLPLPRTGIWYSGTTHVRGVKSPGPEKTLGPKPLSVEDQTNVKEAEKIYQNLRKKSAADDFTPELYFLGVLANYQQYPEMEKLINAMQIKRPGDPTLKDLKAWVHSQSGATK